MPAKFRFALQPLLEWRARAEEEKQRDFFAARRILEECDRELQRLAAVYGQCAKDLVASAGNGRAADFRVADSSLLFLQAAMARARSRRGELQTICDRARDALIIASRDRRVIEKLKERRYREFEAAEARREEVEIDEANARRHERTGRKGAARREAEGAPR